MTTSKKTTIRVYVEQDTIEICQAIIAKHNRGEVTGMIFAIQENDTDHCIGATGSYREDPLLAKQIVGSLFDQFAEMAKPQRVGGGKL